MSQGARILQTAESLAERLISIGLRESEHDVKAALFARALSGLGRDHAEMGGWWVPGRIEFLGKHTDYAGGPSLLCAVERGFAVVAVPRRDPVVSIRDATSGERVETEISSDLNVRRGHWANYPMTVCRRVARNFPGAHRGADIAIASDLPPAAGLSSSSALIVATFLVLADTNELESRDEYRANIQNSEGVAGYLGAVENGSGFRELAGDHGVGTLGGSQDHTAIVCARPHALMQYSFAPIRFERALPLPNDHRFVIAASGVAAEKTGTARELYNRAATLAGEVLQVWRDATGSAAGSLAAALADAPEAEIRLRDLLRRQMESAPERLVHYSDLTRRLGQFTAEMLFVRAAGDALAKGDLDQLGRLVDSSQAIAEMMLDNQVPETIALAESARELGAVAASAFGAGFGGSVYALVRADEAESFRRRWMEVYGEAFPDRRATATFFVSAAGPAATRL